MEAIDYPIATLELEEIFSPEFYLLNARNTKTISGKISDVMLKELNTFQVFLS